MKASRFPSRFARHALPVNVRRSLQHTIPTTISHVSKTPPHGTPPPPPLQRPPPIRAAMKWPPPPPPIPATAASVKWATRKSSLEGVQSKFEAASSHAKYALATWHQWQHRPAGQLHTNARLGEAALRSLNTRMDDAALRLLQTLVSAGHVEEFNAVLASSEFGANQKQRLLRAGRLIKRSRGAQLVRTHSKRPTSTTTGGEAATLVSQIVEWAEVEAASGERNIVKDSSNSAAAAAAAAAAEDSSFFNFSVVPILDDAESLMYVYTQAGYTQDALALWRRQLASSKAQLKPVVASGLVNLLCSQASTSELDEENVVGDILEVLRDAHGLGSRLFPGVAKGLHVLVQGLADHNNSLPCDAENLILHAAAARRLAETLNLVAAFQDLHGITPLRRTYTELLRLCCSTLHLEGPTDLISRQAADFFSELEASSSHAPSKTGCRTLPTRYDYTLLVAALAATHGPRHSSVSTAVSKMKEDKLLPLSDGGILRRAKDGDLAALKGALVVRRLVGEPLNVRATTSVVSILVGHSDRSAPSVGRKFTREAWRVWEDFRKEAPPPAAQGQSDSPNLFVPDLQLFNVALAVAARRPEEAALLDTLESDLRAFGGTDPSSSFAFDSYTFNTLIDAYGRRGDIDRCWALVAEMEASSVLPTIVTYNTLSKACALNGSLDDALKALEAAASRGVQPDHISFRALTAMFSKSNAMVEAIQKAEVSLKDSTNVQGAEGGEMTACDAASNMQVMRTAQKAKVEVDLHHLSLGEAKARITRELDSMYELFHNARTLRDDLEATTSTSDLRLEKNETEGKSHSNSPPLMATEVVESGPRIPELVLITGVGRRSAIKGKAVLRDGVIQMLAAEGVAYQEVPGNPGRLVVSSRELEDFFSRQHTRQLKTMGASWLSYRFALLPSVLAAVLVVPKLVEFYDNHPPLG